MGYGFRKLTQTRENTHYVVSAGRRRPALLIQVVNLRAAYAYTVIVLRLTNYPDWSMQSRHIIFENLMKG